MSGVGVPFGAPAPFEVDMIREFKCECGNQFEAFCQGDLVAPTEQHECPECGNLAKRVQLSRTGKMHQNWSSWQLNIDSKAMTDLREGK